MDWAKTKTTAAVLVSAVVFAAAAPALAQPSQDVVHCTNSGRKFSNDQQIESCTTLIQTGRYSGKNLAIIYTQRGEAHLYKKDNQRAMADYNTAIALDSTYWRPFNDRGVIFDRLNQSERAIADWNEAARLNPRHPWPPINLCEISIEQNRLPDAIDHCNRSINLVTSPIAFYLRAVAHLRLGQIDQSIADFDEAVRQSPKYGVALYGRSIAKRKKNDVAGANADMAAAKSIDADVAEKLAKLGVK